MGCSDSKKAYLELRAKVAEALNAADPIGLIAAGGPSDEYDGETTLVTARLVRANSAAELCAAIHAVFLKSFDEATAGPLDHYASLAASLWKLPRTQA